MNMKNTIKETKTSARKRTSDRFGSIMKGAWMYSFNYLTFPSGEIINSGQHATYEEARAYRNQLMARMVYYIYTGYSLPRSHVGHWTKVLTKKRGGEVPVEILPLDSGPIEWPFKSE